MIGDNGTVDPDYVRIAIKCDQLVKGDGEWCWTHYRPGQRCGSHKEYCVYSPFFIQPLTHEEKLAQIDKLLAGIIKPEGISQWWSTEIPALEGRNARESIEEGDIDRVWTVVQSYHDGGYA